MHSLFTLGKEEFTQLCRAFANGDTIVFTGRDLNTHKFGRITLPSLVVGNLEIEYEGELDHEISD